MGPATIFREMGIDYMYLNLVIVVAHTAGLRPRIHALNYNCTAVSVLDIRPYRIRPYGHTY
jgi:hypothetical protein